VAVAKPACDWRTTDGKVDFAAARAEKKSGDSRTPPKVRRREQAMKSKNRMGWIRATVAAALFIAAPASVLAQSPKVSIIRGDEGMARYAAAAAGADAAKRAQLYAQYVSEPYRERCSGEGERFSMSHGRLNTPIADLEGLTEAAAEIARHPVEERITQALQNATRLLPMKEIVVCLFVFPPDNGMASFVRERMSGFMGFNEAPAVLWLEVLPVKGWFEQLPYGTVHEFEHAASYTANMTEMPLLELMLAEGRADSFAALLYPDHVAPWTHALTPEQERTAWAAMQPYLDSTDEGTVGKFIFGMDKEGGVPLWAGYSIGFQIAQSYLKHHPKEPPTRWSSLDAKTFLARSGYRHTAR
jgi:Predicted Zn-dependent protease (DUF2268)